MYEDIARYLGFQDELRKIAFSPGVAARLSGAGSLAGVGVGVGALVGGLRGAYKNYQASKDESGHGSIGAGLAGGLSGALQGATFGGLGGAALGAAAPGLGKAVDGVGRLKSMADFGKRQVHGLTGWIPEEGLHSIGGGAAGAKAQAAKATANIGKVELQNVRNLQAARAAADTAHHVHDAAAKAEQMGLTSIPGYLKSFRENGVPSTLVAGAKQQWRQGGTLGKALMVGAPALALARSATNQDDPDKGQHVAGRLGEVAALGLAGLPLVPGLAAAGAVTGGAKLFGKGVDKLRHHRSAGDASDALSTIGHTIPHETVMSPAAAEQAPEIWTR